MSTKLENRRLCGFCEDFQPTGETVRVGVHHRTAGMCRNVKGAVLHVHANQLCRFGLHADPPPPDTTKKQFYALL